MAIKIIYARAYTYEHQYNLLLGLAAKMSEEPFRLLVRVVFFFSFFFYFSFSFPFLQTILSKKYNEAYWDDNFFNLYFRLWIQ